MTRNFTKQISSDSKYFKKILNNEKVIYDGSTESVESIIDLVGFTRTILNCWDYKPPKLLLHNKFFNVGTVFKEVKNDLYSVEENNTIEYFDNEGFQCVTNCPFCKSIVKTGILNMMNHWSLNCIK